MSPLSGQSTAEFRLARFLSIEDRYGSHIKPFLRFLEENGLA